MIPNTFIEFYGDQTRWFLGTVIDIYDPLYLGRIRVNIFGVHDEIKDVDLPWAQTVVPITQGGTEGRGNNIGIQEGAQVFGVFLDGPSSQMPLVLGSIPRVEKTIRVNERDEKGNPTKTTSREAMTTSFLAVDGTELEDRHLDELKNDIEINQEKISLRSTVKYPHNKVYETEGVDGKTGHIKEYDDTAGYERIHERHSSGTFYQMGPSGELVTSVKQNEYRKVEGQRITEIGTEVPKENEVPPELAEALSKSGVDLNNYFTEETVVHGNRTATIKGNDKLIVTGDVTIMVEQNATIDVKGEAKVISKESIDLTAPEVTVRGNTIKLNS